MKEKNPNFDKNNDIKLNENMTKEDMKGSVTNVTDVTNVTNVTDVTNPLVTLVTRNTNLKEWIWGGSTFGKIVEILLLNKEGLTYDKIAEKLGKSVSSIKMVINRKKDYFALNRPNGKVVVVTLVTHAIKEIEQKIIEYTEKIEKDKEFERQKEAQENSKKNKKEELINDCKNFIEMYKKELNSSILNGVLNIDYEKLSEISILLADELINNPEETLKNIEFAIEDMGIAKKIRVRVFNLPKSSQILIEEIRSKHIDKLISIKAKIMQSSDARPQAINAKFECPSCGTVISILQMDKKFREPTRCSCGRRGNFRLISKEMVDSARIIIQDLQEYSEKSSPARLNCFVKEDLASKEILNRILNAGNDIVLNGILKEIPVPLKQGGLSTKFELALDVNHIELAEETIDLDKLDEEEIEKFENLSNKIDENGIEILTPSFAPEVIGYEYPKQALILYHCNRLNRPGIDAERNKSNILFIGDPSTAKSVLAKFSVSISVGALKVVGGSSSAVGITGSANKDDFLGGWMINPGALVLAKDLLFLEELNTMDSEEKSKIQDAMESQYVDITKANASARFKVRTGLISCANPVGGHFKLSGYQNKEEIVKQFDIPSPILSRFDSIFLFNDYRSKEKDFEISLSMKRRKAKKIQTEYDKDFLKKFFYYIRVSDEPEMTEEFIILSSKIYAIMRQINKEKTLNARVSEAIDRMSIASAKLRRSEYVEEKDLERAIQILSNSYFAVPNYKEIKKVLEENEKI